jgi:OFA family oxalate/formate antiporter-like MFS transporter
LLVPVAAIIAKNHGWGAVFSVGMTFNIVAALLALFVLKPMRVRHFAKSRLDFPPAAASVAGTPTT